MKFSTTTILLAAALGVSAHPSGHAHNNVHRSVEARREFVVAKKPIAQPPATPTYAPPPSTPTQPAGNSGSDSGLGGYVPFCGGNTKRATLQEIAYKGNVGIPGKYGCNIMQVPESVADKYKYTVKFINKAKDDKACACWLKIGQDNGLNGFFKGNQVLDFTLKVGGSAVIAADSNTQGGCTCTSGPTLATTPIGILAGTWLEFDFENASNKKWSGADASCLVSAAAGVHIPALSVCGAGVCSDVYEGGTGHNAYLGGMEAEDGIGLNIPEGPVSLTVTVGATGKP